MEKSELRLILVAGIIVSIGIAFATLIYIINFHGYSLSGDPANWGVLGDYFGGIINPILSLATLIFVAMTYITQKAELNNAKQSAERADELREISTNAQISLAKSYVEQIESQNRSLQIQVLSASMNVHINNISLFLKEIERVTESMNANRAFTSFEGKEYFSDAEQKQYRRTIGVKISEERKHIECFSLKIKNLLSAQPE